MHEESPTTLINAHDQLPYIMGTLEGYVQLALTAKENIDIDKLPIPPDILNS